MGKALLLDDDEVSWTCLCAQFGDRYTTDGWLDQMRDHGRAGMVVQQRPPPDHIRSVAASMRGAGGAIVTAISVATASQNLDEAAMASLAPACRRSRRRSGANGVGLIAQPPRVPVD